MERISTESPTIRAHRRQFFWQIILPLIVALTLLVTGAVFVVIGGDSQARLWADISTIWLVAPVLILALLGLVVLGFLVYAVARLLKATPRFTSKAQDFDRRISSGTRQAPDTSVKPVLWVNHAGDVWKPFLDALLRRK